MFVGIIELRVTVFLDTVQRALELADVAGGEHDVAAFLEQIPEIPGEPVEELIEVVLNVVGGQESVFHNVVHLAPDLREGFAGGHLLHGQIGVLEDP